MPEKKKPLAVASFTITNIETPEPVVSTDKPKPTRVFRSVEVRIAELDKKIAFHQKSIDQLEAKKSKVGTARRQRKLTYAKVFAELKLSGKTPEEIAALLHS